MNEDDFFSIVYNGTDIGAMVDAVTAISRGIGSGYLNTASSNKSKYGSTIINVSNDSKKVSFDFIIQGDKDTFTAFRRNMATALSNIDGTEKQLTFNDEPNIYYLALPDGTISLNEDIENWQATGTISFIVPDGLAHSVLTKSLSTTDTESSYGNFSIDDDGNLVCTLINESNTEAIPKITLNLKQNTGFVGVSTISGGLQMGKVPVTDTSITSSTSTRTVSQAFITEPATAPHIAMAPSSANFADFVQTTQANPQDGTKLANGTGGFSNTVGLHHTATGIVPAGTHSYQGVGYLYTIPADAQGIVGSQDLTVGLNLIANATKVGQVGLIQVFACDVNLKPIIGAGIVKTTTKNNTGQLHLYNSNGATYKSFNFDFSNGESTYKAPSNSMNNKYFNSKEGNITLHKSPTTSYWILGNNGSTYTAIDGAVYNYTLRYIYVYMGLPIGMAYSKEVGNFGLRGITIQKNDAKIVTTITNETQSLLTSDPNYYNAFETLIIDSEYKQLYKKAGTTNCTEDLIKGSEFIKLLPGTNQLVFEFNDEVTELPDITIEWSEDNE